MIYNPKTRRWYTPTYIAESVTDIDFDALQNRGIEAVLIDLDGTVVARATYDVSAEISAALKSQPLPIYIATNRPKSRDLKDLKERLHAQGVIHPAGFAGKPFPKYFKSACRSHGLDPARTVMIGDRFLQDIIGANSAGLPTVLVKKLDKPTNWFDTLLSGCERRLANHLAHRYSRL